MHIHVNQIWSSFLEEVYVEITITDQNIRSFPKFGISKCRIDKENIDLLEPVIQCLKDKVGSPGTLT